MQTVERAVSSLLECAAPYNPRQISEDDMGSLKRSLTFFGAVEPVVLNTRTGHIVGGHQRLKAAEEIGMETFPVVEVDLDEPSEMSLNLALNRISGSWDDDKLRDVLWHLKEEGADMLLTGFAELELELILSGWDTDFAADKIAESNDALKASIKVLVPQGLADEARQVIVDALGESEVVDFDVV
jgi:ParB-like chromosome segregation protein Spo0J